MEERLQKILARAGISSRRGAEAIIRAGRVAVNGQIVTAMGSKADPLRDTITCDGKPVVYEEKLYVLLNKPAGYVTTLSDPQGRPVVSDLLVGISQRLFPVGRLDLDTEGALLMTNDGKLSQAILHPSFEVDKTYEALVTGSPDGASLQRLARGIRLEDGMTAPASLHTIRRIKGNTLVQITIHEGRKRQVKKMFQAIGHQVLHLKRTAYGNLRLDDLSSGAWRQLDRSDLKKIFPKKIPFTIKDILA
ncbi:MAG: pseudouridine synthase [Desulfobulbus sp.]|jgi:23S rRNA pseudouridine2605 synthase